VSVFIGGFLFHIWIGLDQLPKQWPSLFFNIYFSMIYTTLMFGSISSVGHWLQARISLRSRRDVALHVGGLALTAALSYSAATGLCWMLHPSHFSTDWRALLITGTLAVLVTLVWSAFHYLRAFYRQLRQAEAQRYEARLQALRAQINPHFLFNAFNSIAALIRTRPEEAETVVEDLSDLFRYALRASKDDTATLGEEVQAVRRYLAVEKARFRDRLQTQFDVPDRLRSVAVPSMTLQPLVENAVKHGVGETQGACIVTVAAEASGDTLIVRVTDTGPGFESTDLAAALEEGSGLANVRERLRLSFGEDAQMELLPQGVVLCLPLDEEITPNVTAGAEIKTK